MGPPFGARARCDWNAQDTGLPNGLPHCCVGAVTFAVINKPPIESDEREDVRPVDLRGFAMSAIGTMRTMPVVAFATHMSAFARKADMMQTWRVTIFRFYSSTNCL